MERTLSFIGVDQRECTLRHLYDQVKKGEGYCNLPIRTKDGTVITAHNCVMSMIPFFSTRDHFSGGVSSEPVDLSNISSEILWSIIQFVYLGEFTVDTNDLPELFEAANFLEMRDTLIAKILDKLLQESPALEKVYMLHTLCETYTLDHPGVDNLRVHFNARMNELLDSGLLKSASPNDVLKYINSREYSYVPRIKFAKFLVEWTLLDMDNREEFFPCIFRTIPLQDFDEKDISDLLALIEASFPDKCPEVQERVQEEMETRASLQNFKRAETVPAIIVAGGIASRFHSNNGFNVCHKIPTSNMWVLIDSKSHWMSLPQMPAPLDAPVTVTDGREKILVCNKNDSDMLHCGHLVLYHYSLQDGVWTTVEHKFPRRFRPESLKTLVALDRKVYALVFGYTGRDPSRKVSKAVLFEVKHPTLGDPLEIDQVYTRCKVKVCPLKENVVVEFSHKNYCGTFLVSPVSGCKTKLKMRLLRGYTCQYQGDIMQYKLGRSLRQVQVRKEGAKVMEELYLPEPPRWREPTETGCTSLDGNLVICGGLPEYEVGNFQTVYMYDYDYRTWLQLTDLPEGLHGCGACHVQLPMKFVQCCEGCAHCQAPLIDQGYIWRPPQPQPSSPWH